MSEIIFTIIEKENPECPNIGTIRGFGGIELSSKARLAIEKHFDAKVIDIKFPEGLKFSDIKNSCPIDISVTLDTDVVEEKHSLQIQQTWIY